MSADPVFLVVGPSDHGVVILAEQLVGSPPGGAWFDDATPVVVRARTAEQLIVAVEASPPSWRPTHVHFTDQLFGADCRAAAATYERLAAAVNANAAGLSVTLHDLPMPSDAPDRYRRRSAAYARVIAATTGPVIVCSEHEARLVRAFSPAVRPVVIPLPIEPASGTGARVGRGAGGTDVAILGYVYPGKGHAEALEALGELPIGMGLAALGRVADGHAELADELRRRARTLGRRLTVAGWIADRDLAPRLRSAAIPLVGHRHLSASGSIGSWLAAGRRPLVPDVAYTRELETRNPGAVQRYRPTPGGLRSALARAHADPKSTWLPADLALTPSLAAVAAAYREALVARFWRRQRHIAVRTAKSGSMT